MPRDGHSPDTVVMLAMVAITGIAMTLAGIVPTSVDAVTGPLVGRIWSGTFGLAAAISLTGVLWRGERLTAWAVETAGRIPLALTATGYVVAILGYATNLGAGLAIGIIGSIGVSSAWRSVQLLRGVDRVRHDVQALHLEEGP